MSKPLVTDELWAVIAPLLPAEQPKPKGGRPRIPDRAVLSGLLYVLKSGIPWELLPQEMGCSCGMTCWRRLLAAAERGNGRQTMISVTTGGYTLRVAEAVSEADEPGCVHAALVERFDTDTVDEASGSDVHIHVHAGSVWPTWPFLCVGQRYSPGH